MERLALGTRSAYLCNGCGSSYFQDVMHALLVWSKAFRRFTPLLVFFIIDDMISSQFLELLYFLR